MKCFGLCLTCVSWDNLFKLAYFLFPVSGEQYVCVYMSVHAYVGRVKGFPDLSLSFSGNIWLPDVTDLFKKQLGIPVALFHGIDLNSSTYSDNSSYRRMST